ncbi:Platinum sensitivity protein [Ascosphaera pollenicola]|nr:Platinum sensitivity protein [Ascosphaera pollenicola]
MDEQADIEQSHAARAQMQAHAQAQAQVQARAQAEADAEAQAQAQIQAQSQAQELAVPTVIPRPEERKRVKVYELRASDWFDRGTGMCFAETGEDEPMIIVESEDQPGTLLLETKVMKKDVYQKQQGSCLESHGMLYQAKRNFRLDSRPALTYFRNTNQDDSVSEDALDEYMNPVALPSPSLGNLLEIERSIGAASNPMQSRDMLSKYLLQKNYIAKLVPLVQEAEDLESLEDLHRLCNIMKMIILLNDNAIVEAVVSDELVEGVVGALEYDPDFPTHKANHRQYLNDRNRYKEVVPIEDPMILRKIRCTWRLQYLKDVVLARIIDDPTFSVLNSLIFFNQVAIVQHLQHNTNFLQDLFALFRADNRSPQNMKKKEDALRFLYQCTSVAKNLQPPGRSALYLDFVEHGVFDAIAFAVSHPKSTYRATGVDILMSFLDHDQGTMREYTLLFKHGGSPVNDFTPKPEGSQEERQEEDKTESQEEEDLTANPESQETQYFDTHESTQEDNGDASYEPPRLLTDTLIDLLHVEPDLGVKMQLSDSLKVLLEPIWFFTEPLGRPLTFEDIRRVKTAERTKAGMPGSAGTDSALDALIMRRRFDLAMIRLFAPLKNMNNLDLSKLTFQEAATYEHLLDILSCFLRSHVFWGKRFIYSQQLVPRIAEILEAPQKHLKLAALQTFRTLLHLNDTFYFGEMSRNDVYGKLLQIITDTMPRDNLLASACLELFESVTRHPANKVSLVKPVILCLGAHHRYTLQRITYVDTFRKILYKYDRLLGFSDPLDLSYLTSDDTDAADTDVEGGVGRPRVIAGGQIGYQGLREDREQDDYLEADDEDDLETQEQAQQELMSIHGHPTPVIPPSPSMKPLVDYPEDDEDDEEETEGSSPAGTPSTSPQSHSQQSGDSSGTPTTSPALAAVTQEEQLAAIARGLAEKRRREEDDDDDQLMKLSGNTRKRTASGSGIASSQNRTQQGGSPSSVAGQSPSGLRPRKGMSFSQFGPRHTEKHLSVQTPAKRSSDSADHEAEGSSLKKMHFNLSAGQPSIERREEDDDDDEHADESATAEPPASESDGQ